MIAVFGSGLDERTGQVVRDWPGGNALWIRLEDITGPGWRIDPADPAGSYLRAGDRTIRIPEITGAILTVDHLPPALLHTMDPEDQVYMAQEVEALLTALLAMVDGPVVNSPFSAPYQRRRIPEQWLQEAHQLAIPILTKAPDRWDWQHRVHPTPAADGDDAQRWTTALANATGTPFLSTSWIMLQGVPHLAYATTQVALARPEHARAVHQVFQHQRAA